MGLRKGPDLALMQTGRALSSLGPGSLSEDHLLTVMLEIVKTPYIISKLMSP